MAAAKRVFFLMTHLTKKGEAKSLRECTHPLRAKGVVDLIITDLALLELTREGLLLKERAPDASLEEIIDKTATPLRVADSILLTED